MALVGLGKFRQYSGNILPLSLAQSVVKRLWAMLLKTFFIISTLQNLSRRRWHNILVFHVLFYSPISGGMGTSFCIGSYLFGYICRYIHWKYVFHLTSLCGILWTIGWYFLVFDSPSVHPTIRREEKSKILEKKKYLTNNTKVGDSAKCTNTEYLKY